MSLSNLNENLNIIQSLPDKPSLTPEELKRKFDEAGNKIKSYINDILIDEIEEKISTLNSTLVSSMNSMLSNKLQNIYHIGKIIVEMSNTNPSLYLGFGTWELIGQGQTLVGVDENDEDFNEVGKIGGEKKHRLTINEMPSFQNTIFNISGNGWVLGDGGTPQLYTEGNAEVGKNFEHNNMQPYITTYFWKRTS